MKYISEINFILFCCRATGPEPDVALCEFIYFKIERLVIC